MWELSRVVIRHEVYSRPLITPDKNHDLHCASDTAPQNFHSLNQFPLSSLYVVAPWHFCRCCELLERTKTTNSRVACTFLFSRAGRSYFRPNTPLWSIHDYLFLYSTFTRFVKGSVY